jgi:hypothetical protein
MIADNVAVAAKWIPNSALWPDQLRVIQFAMLVLIRVLKTAADSAE